MSIWSGSDAGNDESTAEPMVEPLEQMRDHVEVPPATSPVDAPMDIAPPEVVPETKKKSATMVKKKKVIKTHRKEEMESVVTIQQPTSQCRFVSVLSEMDDADGCNQVTGQKTCFARSNALTQGMLSLHQAAREGLLEEAEMLLVKNQEKPDTKHIDQMKEEEAEKNQEKPDTKHIDQMKEEEAKKNQEKPEKTLKYNKYIDEVQKDDDIPFRCTALQVAAFYGQVGMVELLLNEKADIDSFGESEQHWSPLHLAAMRGHTAAVEILVNRAADFKAEDNFQRIPLELAMGGPGKILATQTNPDKRITMPDLIMLLKKEGQNATEIITNLMIPAKTVNEKGNESVMWKGELRLSERLQVVTCRRFNQKPKNSMLKHFPKEALVLDKDLDLPTLDLNLLHVPEIKVVLRVLPYFVASTACDRQVLSALANTGNEATLATDTVYAMISAAWSKVRNRTAAEIMLNAVNVGLLCYVSYGFTLEEKEDRANSGAISALYVLIFIHVKMTLEELVQQLEALFLAIHSAYSDWKSKGSLLNVNIPPFLDIDQVTDMGYQVLGCVALFKQLNKLDELEKGLMAVFSAMAWFRFCYSLRGEPWFGPRILPILFALRDTVVFFFFALICVCAATHAYYNLQLREKEDGAPSTLYQALLQVTRLGIFGDFDIFDFEGADPYLTLKKNGFADFEDKRLENGTEVYVEEDPLMGGFHWQVHILFYGVGLGITILLMNLLIGVLGSNFDLYQDRAPELFNRARAKLLLEIEGRPIIRVLRHLGRVAQELNTKGRWHVAMLVTSVWTCVAVLQSLFHFVLLLCALPFIVILTPFCSWSGVYHTIVRLLKGHFNKDDAESQYIWVVQKEHHFGVELRSLHALVKEKVNELHAFVNEKVDVVDVKVHDLGGTLQSKLSNMEQKIDRLMERLDSKL